MKRRNIILWILIIAWIAVIWGHSMQIADISEQESALFLDFFSKIISKLENNDTGMYIVRKSAHFTEYLILG
ncbi:MAG: VanZ family protein, partial [Pseudobutyrivibrio sp.]|nr:VanZ family protein [Pseudobutyrivibrio sp.]